MIASCPVNKVETENNQIKNLTFKDLSSTTTVVDNALIFCGTCFGFPRNTSYVLLQWHLWSEFQVFLLVYFHPVYNGWCIRLSKNEACVCLTDHFRKDNTLIHTLYNFFVWYYAPPWHHMAWHQQHISKEMCIRDRC